MTLLSEAEMAKELARSTLKREAREARAARRNARVEARNRQIQEEAARRWAEELALMSPGKRLVHKYADQIAWGDRNNNLDFMDELAADIDAAVAEAVRP